MNVEVKFFRENYFLGGVGGRGGGRVFWGGGGVVSVDANEELKFLRKFKKKI